MGRLAPVLLMVSVVALVAAILFARHQGRAGADTGTVVTEPVTIAGPDGNLAGTLYRAAGAGPHPALVLLHGFPGVQRNLDLAEAVSGAGWQVLVFSYRGAGESTGSFSFGNSIEDAHSAVAYLRANAGKLGVNPARIVLAGHSMGALVAARAAADDRAIAGVVAIDPWNVGAQFRGVMTADARDEQAAELATGASMLNGTSGQALAEEAYQAGARFDMDQMLPALAGRPLLLIGATQANGAVAKQLAQAAENGGHVTLKLFDTDHNFTGERPALARTLVEWLQDLGID